MYLPTRRDTFPLSDRCSIGGSVGQNGSEPFLPEFSVFDPSVDTSMSITLLVKFQYLIYFSDLWIRWAELSVIGSLQSRRRGFGCRVRVRWVRFYHGIDLLRVRGPSSTPLGPRDSKGQTTLSLPLRRVRWRTFIRNSLYWASTSHRLLLFLPMDLRRSSPSNRHFEGLPK